MWRYQIGGGGPTARRRWQALLTRNGQRKYGYGVMDRRVQRAEFGGVQSRLLDAVC